MPNSFKQFIQATLPQRTPMSNTLFAGKSGHIRQLLAVCRCRQINQRTGDKIRKRKRNTTQCRLFVMHNKHMAFSATRTTARDVYTHRHTYTQAASVHDRTFTRHAASHTAGQKWLPQYLSRCRAQTLSEN